MIKHEEARVGSDANGVPFPVIGASITGLGEHLQREGKLTSEGFAQLRTDTVEIVRRCRRFDSSNGQLTGLVVGYVQSGKTMSMTAVSALARDNGCRIIVLLAGVTTNLLEQNATRLRTDLRAASGPSAWRIINSSNWPQRLETDVHALEKATLEWRNPAFGETDKQTFLIMVLKQHLHLENLVSLLKRVDLKGVPALILDDEADQAGLNTKPTSPDPSTTYDRIRRVRAALPSHTYLQYTATPQANLLIALDDMLSPAFAELVRPGAGYTGGQSFFGPSAQSGLIRQIPANDLFKPGTPPTDPPVSLTEALAVFFVGCAIASIRGEPTPRSMLIHPSARKTDHQRFVSWTNENIRRWVDALSSSEAEDRADALAEFETGYRELLRTNPTGLPPFAELAQRIELALSRVEIKEVNGEDGSEVDWDNADAHILVGGEKLNRGFTVVGLMVTYMPRGTGEWNADTIQQRARFFGYKSKYLSLCRLYLDPAVIAAFRSYVTHEEDIRSQLAAHRGRPLRDWRRAFFMDAALRPTRRNVISDDYHRIQKDQAWFIQRRPHADPQAIDSNRALIKALVAGLKFETDETAFYKHEFASLPLTKLREALVAYDVRDSDRAGWYAQLILLSDVCDSNPNREALILRMSGDRERAPEGDAIALHQGASSKAGKYPGDNKMLHETNVTLQIHSIDIKGGPKGVVGIALHIPKSLRKSDVGVLVPRT